MSPYLQSVVLGIVEGLTEFLPVSSTAHLRICEDLLGIDLGSGYWKAYSIVIQLGAILSLVVYFWRRITRFLADFPQGEGKSTVLTHPLSLVVAAFLVTAIPSYLLRKQIGQNLENLGVMGASLVIGGLLMWVVDAACRTVRTPRMDDMRFWQALWIGAAQTLSAVFPGTSRSMVTIAAGQLAALSRSAALEFSFFLSIPTMVAATGSELVRIMFPQQVPGDPLGPVSIDSQGWIVLGIGFVVSFIVALGVVAWFMRWVRQRGLGPFALYRILLGTYVLIAAWRSAQPAGQ